MIVRRSSGGFALPAVLVVMIALALVASAAAVLTSTEVRVAALYNLSNRASAAATGALEHAVGHFLNRGPDEGWPVTGTVSGYDYSVAIARDSFDFGSGVAPVSWSAADGHNGNGDGGEVWVLTAIASRGPYQAEQRMRITTMSGTILTTTPFSSGSSFGMSGNSSISGVDASGDASCEDGPAVTLSDPEDEVDVGGSADLDGGDEYSDGDPPYVTEDPSVRFVTPEDVFGLPAGSLDSFQSTPAEFDADPVDPLEGVVYVTGDFGSNGAGSGDLSGSGVLIVHNPLFDPREHDPDDPLYDPVKAADPAYAPATLGNINSGTFEGVIIADTIDKLAGRVEILGSVIMLRRTDDGGDVITGRASVQRSCTAIETATQGLGGVRRLSWSSL